MTVGCQHKGGIETLHLFLSESADGALGALEALLARPSLKAIMVLVEDRSARLDDSGREALLQTAADRIVAGLRRAAVPTAGVVSPSASEPARRIVRACHFAFASADQAMAYLGALTAGRPPHVIRAVMASINNLGRMPLEEALLAETRLFCELSSRKRGAGRGSRP
jgi:hypothetical protein